MKQKDAADRAGLLAEIKALSADNERLRKALEQIDLIAAPGRCGLWFAVERIAAICCATLRDPPPDGPLNGARLHNRPRRAKT